jgi:hypothetical protein
VVAVCSTTRGGAVTVTVRSVPAVSVAAAPFVNDHVANSIHCLFVLLHPCYPIGPGHLPFFFKHKHKH